MTILQGNQALPNSDDYNTDYVGDTSDSFDFSSFLPTAPEQSTTRANARLGRGGECASARHKKLQRQRLLRYLISTLQQGEPNGQRETGTSAPRRRPRLVLLGNQKTLILGVVLSGRGGATADRG